MLFFPIKLELSLTLLIFANRIYSIQQWGQVEHRKIVHRYTDTGIWGHAGVQNTEQNIQTALERHSTVGYRLTLPVNTCHALSLEPLPCPESRSNPHFLLQTQLLLIVHQESQSDTHCSTLTSEYPLQPQPQTLNIHLTVSSHVFLISIALGKKIIKIQYEG